MRPLLLILSLFSITVLKAQKLDVISPEEAGLNRDSVNYLIGAIQETSHKDFRGLVVIKDDKIVIEEYFNTFWRNTILDIRSAGKSITALLLGVAIQEGLIHDLDQDVYSLFSKSKNRSVNEDYKKIKLRHLLDMSSGLDADTNDPQTPGQAGNWMGKDDWKEYLLNIPVNSKPGKRWVYADINALLIGLAIEEASGMSLRDYAQQKLFAPLEIEQVYWYTNAANQTGAAGNLYLTTLDFAKLGLLVVNGGKWNGTQLMNSDYTKELVEHKNFDLSKEFSLADSYGLLWYKSTRTFAGKKTDYLFASGNGGNQLIVIPDKKMVIALTASAYGQRYAHGRSNTIMTMILNALE
ncbi:MAG: serine hydrolase [Roseivirga sp.]|nr:serine hydrolase [Roseivirga sp.]